MPKLATKPSESKTILLEHGRRLEVSRSGDGDVVEVRAESGQLELRVVLTAEGPVLQLDAVKLALRAEDSVEIDCKSFAVKTTEDVSIAAEGDTRVVGKRIFLN